MSENQHIYEDLNESSSARPMVGAFLSTTVQLPATHRKVEGGEFERIWTEVIGHLWAELGFWFSQEKGENICGREFLDRRRIFWQVVPVQQPVQYGRDAAHIIWEAWVQIPLEDCMVERQHHLNESSSARLRRSQKLEILPSPNSKSLGAYFLAAYIFHKAQRFQWPPCYCRILWGADILDEAHIF